MNDIKARLLQDHQEIDVLLGRLAEDVVAPDSAPLQVTWCQVETRLLGHMDAEEQYLLPLIEASHPAEAARTRLEHVRIRQIIYELGVAIELHAARQPTIDALVALLREHAQQEDAILYELAAQRASSMLQDRVVGVLRAALQRALAATVGTAPSASRRPDLDHRVRS